MPQLISKCVDFMVRSGVIADTQEQREIYAYGLELILYYIVNVAVLLCVGFLFGRAIEVAAFLFLFGLLQSNGGGYHADTHGKCLLIMIAGILLFILALSFGEYLLAQFLSVLSGVAIVICLTPVTHRNHPLSLEMSSKMGIRAKLYALMFALFWGICFSLDILPAARQVVSLVMLFTSISMMTAWIKQNGQRYKE